MSKATKVRKVNLVQEVAARIREQILGGAFPPGSRLPPEGRLSESFGVSRTVVREAMRTLRAQGLVEVSQGRRPWVKPADTQAAVETLGALLARGENSLLRLVEVRRPLETEIASLAAERAAPGDVAALEEAIREMLSAGSMEARVEADLRFHDRLAAATGNPVFQILLATMAELMHRSRRQTLARSGVDAAVEGHRAVLAAVARHDPQAARQTMLDHLAKAERDLRGESP